MYHDTRPDRGMRKPARLASSSELRRSSPRPQSKGHLDLEEIRAHQGLSQVRSLKMQNGGAACGSAPQYFF